MKENSWVKISPRMYMKGKRARGRLRKTSREVLRDDLRAKGLSREDTRNQAIWSGHHVNMANPCMQNDYSVDDDDHYHRSI